MRAGAARTVRRMGALRALWEAVAAGARGGPPVGARMAALPRMLRASLRGEYDGGGRALLMAAAAAYVVSPVDLLPEGLLFAVGLADDALVVTWLAGAVLAETTRFLDWERRRAATIDGDALG
ncbi:MAG TPA: YkvA family protein [Pilimelia sp.]|nr:YkvA family protein [Pilimelia sp.]